MLSPSSVLKDALFLCHTKGGGGGVTKYDNGGGGLKMPKCALCNIGRTLLILREGLVRNHQEILSRWLRLVSQTYYYKYLTSSLWAVDINIRSGPPPLCSIWVITVLRS